MLSGILSRLRLAVANLPAWISWSQYRLEEGAYELLPVPPDAPSEPQNTPRSTEIQSKMKQTRSYPNGSALTVLLILLLLLIGGVSAGLMYHHPAHYPNLLNATIETLGEGLARRKFTSVDLVKAYLSRISEVNDTLHMVTEVNPDAVTIAAQLDHERLAGLLRGPLHGIPILIKNNIATDDKMNTTSGSWALIGAEVPKDATVIQKLRAAGAILLGKTNISQWANFRSLNTSNGWSAHGGQTYGPYYPEEDPSGSSSGSGVATALGLTLGTLGTETDGSITDPAGWNNLVGIKPTVGLTSRYLVIPISEHQDTVGPLTRTIKDGAYMLQAIAGVDPMDNYTSAIPGKTIPNFVAACDFSALFNVRIGIPRNAMLTRVNETLPPVLEAFEQALVVLKDAGAILIEDTNFTAAEEFRSSQLPTLILGADSVVDLQKYLDSLTYNPANITSLTALRNFTQSVPIEDYPRRDTALWDAALDNWNNTDPRFWPAFQHNFDYGDEGGLLGAIRRHNLDAVVMPAKIAATWATIVGAPVVSVPLGFYPPDEPVVKTPWGLIDSGPNIPFGLSFLGANFADEKLIGMAYAFEQRTNVRDKVQPYIVPKTEIWDIMGK